MTQARRSNEAMSPVPWRDALVSLLPPILVSGAKRAVALGRAEWKYLPEGWPESGGGWSDPSVLKTQLNRWPQYVQSVQEPAPLGLSQESGGRSGPADIGAHNTAMAFAYVLALAARSGDHLSLLDWGGGLGQYGVLARALVPSLDLEYHCRDLPLLVSGGKRLMPGDHFYETDDEALARTYDLVVASSSLQYVRDWRDILERLAAATAGYLYVTRQPFVARAASFVVEQRPHRHGYKTEYPGWFLNRGEFLEASEQLGLRLHREFLIAERPYVFRAPEQADYRGYLFEAARRAES